jgi:hypothetical protein
MNADERILSLCAIAEPWHAQVDGKCQPVACFALVSITDTLEEGPETWQTVRAVVADSIEQSVDLEGAHPARECHAGATAVTFRSAGRLAAA